MGKIIYFLFAILLLQFSCALIPNVSFQQENFQKQETIIGEIKNALSDLTRDDLKIYEDRREVLFEKDIKEFNDTYYFYIIPPKAGTFKLQINNILYNDGELKSMNFEKIMIINDNTTQILTIRPGFYSGFNPELFLINSGNESLDIEIDDEKTNLASGSSIKKVVNSSYGISYLNIKSYKNFNVPIINLKIIEVINQTINQTDNQTTYNETENITETYDALIVPQKIEIQKIVGEQGYSFFEITNIGSLKNITLKNTNSVINLTNSIFIDDNHTIKINLSIDTNSAGVYSGKIEFYSGDEKINVSQINIYVFTNETNQQEFNSPQDSGVTTTSCSASQGFLCKEGESCESSSFYWDTSSNSYCCSIECTKENETKKDASSIIIGILSFIFIGTIGYFIYKRNKKIKNLSPEDKFKEVDKKYTR